MSKISTVLLVSLALALLSCVNPINPKQDPTNVTAKILLCNTKGITDETMVKDTVGYADTIKLKTTLGYLIDSAFISITDDSSFDSTIKLNDFSSDLQSFVFFPKTAGIYSVNLTAHLKNKNTITDDGTIIFYKRASRIIQQTLSTLKEVDDNLILFVGLTDTSKVASYSWFKNSTLIPNSNNDSISLTNLSVIDSGTYYCIVKYTPGFADTSAQIFISISANITPLVITKQPISKAEIAAGSKFVMSVSASGKNTISYLWIKNGVPDSSQKDSNYVINSALFSDSGIYVCKVLDGRGTQVLSTACTLVVKSTASKPVITNQLSNSLVFATKQFNLIIEASGTNLSYKWFKDSLPLNNQNSNVLSFSSLVLSDSGQYYCIVSNSLGSDTTNIARLRVVDGYYSITIITTGKGEVRAFGDSSLVGIPLNSSRTLFFKPDSGYRIKEIAIDGTLSDSARRSTEYTFSSINKNHTCVVSFEPIPSVKHLLSVIVDTTKGSVIRSITADSIIAGTEVTLTAIPKEYYRFPGWTGDTTSGQNPLILQVNANRSLTAVFTGDTAIYKKPLSPIMSINTEIYRATASASNQVTLVPKSGLYDDGTLEAVGALDIVIRK